MCIRDRLKSGGYLVIEPTEAMTVIDVNTGKYSGRKNIDVYKRQEWKQPVRYANWIGLRN